jgi:glycosyltransferase involved in cell wall biosynthesis
VLLEAAVAGVPTVGTAVGHLAEWAPQAALTVPVGDWASLAHGIRRVMRDDALPHADLPTMPPGWPLVRMRTTRRPVSCHCIGVLSR